MPARARHSGSARCAASIARRVSAAPSRGTRAIVSPVAGLSTGNVSPESASIQAPSTYAWLRSSSGSRSDRLVVSAEGIG